jgi:hypothetical protein
MSHLQEFRISLFNVSDALHRENLGTLLINLPNDQIAGCQGDARK